MAKVVVTQTQSWRTIAVRAGGDPNDISYDPSTNELEVPGVVQATLDSTVAGYDTLAPTADDITAKVMEMATSAENLIVGGLQSTAGGLHVTAKWYDSEPEDQLNLVGIVSSAAANESVSYPCRDTKTGPKTFMVHSKTEIRSVLADGRDRKLTILQEFDTKKAAAQAATTMGELEAIVWTMT